MALGFNDSHYVPILKGKQGELDAIKETAGDLRKNFTPLIEVPPIPPKYIEGEDDPIPAKSIDSHISDACEKFAKSLGSEHSVFVDGFYIENDKTLIGGSEPIAGVFSALRDAGVRFIPMTGLDRVEEYGDAVRSAIEEDDRGCALRLWESDLEALTELENQIGALLKFLRVDPPEVDLIVDFGPNVPARCCACVPSERPPNTQEMAKPDGGILVFSR